MANEHRRNILLRFSRGDETMLSRDELVGFLEERSVDDSSYRPLNSQQLAVRLRHIHLPKLADHGLLTYDESRELVSYVPNPRVEEILDILAGVSESTEA